MASPAIARAAKAAIARTHARVAQARALVEAASTTGDLFTRRTLADALAILRAIETDTAGPTLAETRREPANPAAERGAPSAARPVAVAA